VSDWPSRILVAGRVACESTREPATALLREKINRSRLPLRRLLRSRFLWQFTLSKVFSDPVWYFYAFWFPQYLKGGSLIFTGGKSAKRPGYRSLLPPLGNLAGGAVFTGLLRTGTEAATARRVAILIFTVLMVSAVFVGDRNNAAQCIALISTATFGYSGALANLLAVPGDVFPKGAVASIWGFASVGSGVGGMIFSLVTGWLVDHFSFRPVFVLFGAIPFVAAWLVWTLPRKTEFSELPPGTEVGSQSSY
jgi:MFS transporter, ACS family, hexuronate transporter